MKILIFLLVFYPLSIFAHQPKLINYSPSFDNAHDVVYPEISKAYYSKLEGEPHYYKIESDRDFLFYTGILSPKVNDNYKWLSIEVLNENKEVIYNADGEDFNWNEWYERIQSVGTNFNLDTYHFVYRPVYGYCTLAKI